MSEPPHLIGDEGGGLVRWDPDQEEPADSAHGQPRLLRHPKQDRAVRHPPQEQQRRGNDTIIPPAAFSASLSRLPSNNGSTLSTRPSERVQNADRAGTGVGHRVRDNEHRAAGYFDQVADSHGTGRGWGGPVPHRLNRLGAGFEARPKRHDSDLGVQRGTSAAGGRLGVAIRRVTAAAREAIVLAALPAGFFGILFGLRFGVSSGAAGTKLIASTVLSAVALSVAIYLTAGMGHP